jgi:cyclopropane-fatty-acyl-phospholipid synthase
MARDAIRARAEELLALAGVTVDGAEPWDIRVRDRRLFARVLAQGSLGLGESYMDGWWDCPRLDEFFHRVLGAGLDAKVQPWHDALRVLRARLVNLQRPARAFEVGRRHYDIGNDLFARMLDRRMIYSCGYWKDAATLDEAQEAKLDLVCRKLALAPGMRVLDIGCGWGGTARFAAERYGVAVVGLTVSAEQARHAAERCAGLDVEIRLEDYRRVAGTFDRVLSIGMFEHVGYKNYATFMRVVRDHLARDGLFLLHTIGGNRSLRKNDPWTERYIFPNSMLPSARQIAAAIEDAFVLEDWHGFGPDYDRTLMAWHANVERAWPELGDRYDERFRRMWRYFLLSSAGGFRARSNQLWQLVLSPHGVAGGYRAPR